MFNMNVNAVIGLSFQKKLSKIKNISYALRNINNNDYE